MILMYLRKSRSDDATLTVEQVLEKHENILQDFCANEYGAPLAEDCILREVVSGETISDRPMMRELLHRIANEDIDGVLVVEPQRLSRGDLMDCGTICRVFKYSNTKIVTPRKVFDLTDKYDLKFFEMELRQGNEYLEYIKMIMDRGKRQNLKSGQYIASHPPYGYDKAIIDGKKTLVPNDDAPVVKLIYELYKDGFSPWAIAKELDRRGIKPPMALEWSQKSVEKILSNVHYIGKIKYKQRARARTVDEFGNVSLIRTNAEEETFDGLHPAIISNELWNDVQRMRGRTSHKPSQKKFASPFAGLVKCGKCGYSVTLNTYGGKKPARMVCRRRQKCGNRSIGYNAFVDEVIKALKAHLHDFEIEVTDFQGNTESGLISAYKADLIKLERQQVKLYDLLEKGIYTESLFEERNAKLAEERQRLESALAEEEKKVADVAKFEAYTVTLYSVIDKLKDEAISAEDKNILLKGMLSQIIYTREGDEVSIELRW